MRRRGYRILDRHVTSRYGELDLVAEHDGLIVFIEVKARRSAAMGQAIESVTKKKLESWQQAAETYLQQKDWLERPIRFDVITLDHRRPGTLAIRHLKGIGE